MGLFSRKPQPAEPDVATFLLQGEDALERANAAHRDQWGLGSATAWGVNLSSGTITWTFPDKVVTAPAQILGSHVVERNSWRWSWANPAIPATMTTAASSAKQWGDRQAMSVFTEPEVTLNSEQLASVVALAFRINKAQGYYRGGSTGAVPHILFGPATIELASGESSTFGIEFRA